MKDALLRRAETRNDDDRRDSELADARRFTTKFLVVRKSISPCVTLWLNDKTLNSLYGN